MTKTMLTAALMGLFLSSNALAGGEASVALSSPIFQHSPKGKPFARPSALLQSRVTKARAISTPSYPVPFKALAMRTAQDGWALSQNALWSTIDGGRKWQPVTPPHVTVNDPGIAPTGWFGADFGVAWDFVGSHSAWVATTMAKRSGTFLLSHTRDSGKRWTQTRIHLPLTTYTWRGSQALEIDFISNRIGWLAIGPGPAGPQNPMELWQTTNSGQSWHRMYVTEAFGGALAFTSAQDGWLVFQAPADNGALFLLRHTTTAGRSWQTMSVPNLNEFANYMNGSDGTGLTWQGSDGALAGSTIQLGAPHGYLAVLQTTNDGQTWTVSPQLAAHSNKFASAATAGSHSWAIADGHLYTWSLRQRTWTNHTSAPWLAHATGLDAVNGAVAFVWKNTKNRSEIWRTTDGGDHWARVGYTKIANG
ncbi:MAG: hypothetical protein C7B45_14505 [Sulfobacillus acidophilus]|uniref:Photosynthesis system II assembly factor Ycf48/Hcf136-like domain-containing protein n=1 Tax=Sulfobacillus acidophilus TaxID=53633 RepID=A0A2T2WE82_9FIRM|nr:MAG: hypothetical protein C7B45_14505 [Sulfobacillus acidophilus]